MKLYLNSTSPYARFTRVAALEKGVGDKLDLQWCDPWTADDELIAVNPLSRIPALVCHQGGSEVVITESLLIAQYLNTLPSDTRKDLLPEEKYAQVMHFCGLGMGLMDSAFQTAISRKYLDQNANQSVLGVRRIEAIERTLIQLESEAHLLDESGFHLGEIALAVALDYINFRLPEIQLSALAPQLVRWWETANKNPSLQKTRFQ